jgi:uracil-DNA glycosylase family 4
MQGFFSKSETASKSRPEGKRYSCASCGLYKNCENPKMKPSGNFKKGILNIGSFNTKPDDKNGKQWQDASGRLLQRTYEKLGIDLFEDCLNINAINCFPGPETDSISSYVANCRKSILQTIDEHNPNIIVLFGVQAIESVIGTRWKKDLGDLHKWRGWTIPDNKFNAWLCPVFHPSDIDPKKQEWQTIWEQDLEQVVSLVNVPVLKYKEPVIEVIEDLERLREIKSDTVVFDYECSGVKPHAKGHRIVCCAVANTPDHAYVFMMPKSKSKRQPFIDLLENNLVGKIAANCLHAKSKILMADGSKQFIERIVKNKITSPVLSYNENTNIVESKPIVNWIKMIDKNTKWKKIITENSIKTNRGYQSHCLTADHKVFIIGKGMIRTDQVQVDDDLLLYKKGISENQLQIILGSGLGDGHLGIQKGINAKNANFTVAHGPKQKDYLKWKYAILKNISGDILITKNNNQKGFSIPDGILYGLRTQSLPVLTPIYKMLYKNNKKIITKEYLEKMTNLGFAVWFMDDGSITHTKNKNSICDIMRIHVNGFDKDSINILMNYFKEKYKIIFTKNEATNNSITKDGRKKYKNKQIILCLSKRNGGSIFCKMIASYVHPDLAYKIPNYYKREIGRNSQKVVEITNFINCTPSKVLSIIDHKPSTIKNIKYCIEVKDNHNFFTTTGLMSNCKYELAWTKVKLKCDVKNWCFDTMLAAHLLDNRPGISGLKFQAFVQFGVEDYSIELDSWLHSGGKDGNEINRIFELIETQKGIGMLLKYCALDAIYEYRLSQVQMKQLNFQYLPF